MENQQTPFPGKLHKLPELLLVPPRFADSAQRIDIDGIVGVFAASVRDYDARRRVAAPGQGDRRTEFGILWPFLSISDASQTKQTSHKI